MLHGLNRRQTTTGRLTWRARAHTHTHTQILTIYLKKNTKKENLRDKAFNLMGGGGKLETNDKQNYLSVLVKAVVNVTALCHDQDSRLLHFHFVPSRFPKGHCRNPSTFSHLDAYELQLFQNMSYTQPLSRSSRRSVVNYRLFGTKYRPPPPSGGQAV
jgi:hypothetical protein